MWQEGVGGETEYYGVPCLLASPAPAPPTGHAYSSLPSYGTTNNSDTGKMFNSVECRQEVGYKYFSGFLQFFYSHK